MFVLSSTPERLPTDFKTSLLGYDMDYAPEKFAATVEYPYNGGSVLNNTPLPIRSNLKIVANLTRDDIQFFSKNAINESQG